MNNDTAEGGAARQDTPAEAQAPEGTPVATHDERTEAATAGTASTTDAAKIAEDTGVSAGEDTVTGQQGGAAAPASTQPPASAQPIEAAPPSSALPPPPAEPQPAGRRGGGCASVIWTLIVVAVLAVGAFFTRATWWPAVEPYVGELLPATAGGAGSELAGKIEGVLADQATMHKSLADLGAALKTLQDKVGSVEGRVDTLAGRIEGPGGPPAVAAAGSAAGAASTAQPAVAAAVAGIGQKAEALGRQTETLVKQTEALSQQTETLAKQTTAVGKQAETLSQRVDELAHRADGVDAQLSQLAEAPAAAKALMPRVDALETDSLQTKRLADRFREVETATKETVDKAQHMAAVVLAVQQLKAALAGSAPFADQLTAAQALATDDAGLHDALAALDPYAAKGVPTFAVLRARFTAVAAAVSRGPDATEAGEGWGERTLRRLTSLVTIRRVGSTALQAGGTDAALAQAEDALAAGDLAGAVAALAGVEGSDAEPLQPWLADARARLTADKAIADAETRAIAQLRAARG